jgi:hypothetical protein
MLLWERSRTVKWYWLYRKSGISTLSASDAFDNWKKTSWNFGIKLSKVASSVTSLLFSQEKNLRLEWFIKGFIEVGTSKRLFDSERNLRDMMLVRGPEAIFLVNWFSETSNSYREDKFPKQSGSEPPKLFPERSNCFRFFNSHQPVQFISKHSKIVLKESFIDDVIIGGWRVVNLP